MYSYFYKNGKESADGKDILRYKICLPEFEGRERMSRFYGEIARSVLSFCEGELKLFALKQYEERRDERGRLGYPMIIYTLNGRVTYCDGEHLFVLIEAVLKRRGERAQICRRYDCHGWTLSSQLLMPPRDVLALAAGDRPFPREAKRAKDLFILDGRLFSCERERISEIEFSMR